MRSRTLIVVALAAGLLGLAIAARLSGDETAQRRSRDRGPAPVEVATVENAPIELRRTFAGTLEARSSFVVAAHVGGRVEKLLVDLSDPVKRGQVIAELDDAEYTQSVAEAAAELAVARANLADAESGVELARRELTRLDELQTRGVVSDSQVDGARTRSLAENTSLEVARAQVTRATAALSRARIRSGYARVVALWGDDEDRATDSRNDDNDDDSRDDRLVARRHVDEGDMITPGAPLVTVVDLEPLNAVVHVTEKEYARLQPGQTATITTDAFPEKSFAGTIRRIAPVFQESSRQARMELEVPNRDHLLKPGMFIRAEVVLERIDDAIVIPFAALTTRDGQSGVFVVDAGDEAAVRVLWRPVRVGIRQGERVQVSGEGIAGRVVTLGQQLIADGSAIEIPGEAPAARPARATKPDDSTGQESGSRP